ncbi:Lrp/AsnC family transcriptional regulator [Candidatus Micrarchaeota archaeon]|nr:Lrp/AsnC family transcriptional regulator [Candidatus Micrarchaeota archaeon]
MEKVRLDAIDRKILAELDKNCRIPNSLLAKKVRRSREAVKYRIGQLQKKGVIEKFITSTNPNKFGYYMFKVYLKLENLPKERERFFSELRSSHDIYWMGICDGAFDCIFAILSRDITGYYEKINALLSKWRHLIVSKVLGTMVDTKQYNKKFFTNSAEGSFVTFAGNVAENKADALDERILDVLVNDARIPISELARKVGSGMEAVRRRMKRMEEAGVILQYRIAVDFNKLGLEFFKAIIYLKTLSKKDEAALGEWMRQHPKSLYYIRSIAPWDVEFEFAVENYQEFNAIINEMRGRFPHVVGNCEHVIFIEEKWMPGYLENAQK